MEGSRDGTSLYSQFHAPIGIAVEFGNVVYVGDYMVGSIRMLTTMKGTAMFLSGIRSLMDAFSIHAKYGKHEKCNIEDATEKVPRCLEVIDSNIGNIRRSHHILPSKLNGPEGSIAAKTFESISLVQWGLVIFKDNLNLFQYHNINLLSCTTSDIEHRHSTVNFQLGEQIMLQYARSFSIAIKESLKSLTECSALYFTSRESWYPLPDGALRFEHLKFPKPSETPPMDCDSKFIMR